MHKTRTRCYEGGREGRKEGREGGREEGRKGESEKKEKGAFTESSGTQRRERAAFMICREV